MAVKHQVRPWWDTSGGILPRKRPHTMAWLCPYYGCWLLVASTGHCQPLLSIIKRHSPSLLTVQTIAITKNQSITGNHVKASETYINNHWLNDHHCWASLRTITTRHSPSLTIIKHLFTMIHHNQTNVQRHWPSWTIDEPLINHHYPRCCWFVTVCYLPSIAGY